MKVRKARSRPGARTSGAKKTGAMHPGRPLHGRAPSLAASRSSRPTPHRSTAQRLDSGRPGFKRSSPHPSEAGRTADALMGTLEPALAVVPGPSGGPRMAPRFPEDDYEYGYLHDFLGLDYVPRDCRAVVFGCGKGEEAVFFSERGYRVTGIDSDRNSIGLARERAWLNGRDIDFMIGDVFESANLLPAESFGLASDRGVFRTIEGERERRRYLDLVRRLLLPGGVFLLAATVVDQGRKAKATKRRRTRRSAANQDHLLVQEGGEVMGEILRAGLSISGRKQYAIPPVNGSREAKAELLLYCRR